ncbi:MAG: hypothetical protein M3R36_10200 [Bacteroidota bacterium]|nr:hypothetical protein [Bacteroidota bacterium]
MKFLIAAVINISLLLSVECYSQDGSMVKKNDIRNLKDEILKSPVSIKQLSINSSTAPSQKSPAFALLLSVILPGAGHYYIGRMDVGKYFFGFDVASWIGLGAYEIYGNDLINDAKTFSVEHAKVTNTGDKDDNYFANVGNFNNIYEYNIDQLLFGEYGSLYDVNQYYWDWDNTSNRDVFESQRKASERAYNNRIIFGSMLIANRIVSGISAYLLTNKVNKKTSSINVEPELLYKENYSFDGVKINLSKNF